MCLKASFLLMGHLESNILAPVAQMASSSFTTNFFPEPTEIGTHWSTFRVEEGPSHCAQSLIPLSSFVFELLSSISDKKAELR